jgi:hypothetical protein
MRHSGRTFRPPGPDFPGGIMPDLWGFGSSREPPAVAPARRRQPPRPIEVRPRPYPPLRLAPAGDPAPQAVDPLTAMIGMVARLFG